MSSLKQSLVGRILGADPTNVGTDPDYRFTLANERTFLAWIRTAMALVAGGLGAIHLIPDDRGSQVLGLLLLALSFLTSASAYRRWFRSEQAIRLGRPLPTSRLPQVMAYSVAIVAVVTATLFIVGGLEL
ncbi:MAG: DUF202 domain-containing protein [Acidimicrobiales bacterium]